MNIHSAPIIERDSFASSWMYILSLLLLLFLFVLIRPGQVGFFGFDCFRWSFGVLLLLFGFVGGKQLRVLIFSSWLELVSLPVPLPTLSLTYWKYIQLVWQQGWQIFWNRRWCRKTWQAWMLLEVEHYCARHQQLEQKKTNKKTTKKDIFRNVQKWWQVFLSKITYLIGSLWAVPVLGCSVRLVRYGLAFVLLLLGKVVGVLGLFGSFG